MLSPPHSLWPIPDIYPAIKKKHRYIGKRGRKGLNPRILVARRPFNMRKITKNMRKIAKTKGHYPCRLIVQVEEAVGGQSGSLQH